MIKDWGGRAMLRIRFCVAAFLLLLSSSIASAPANAKGELPADDLVVFGKIENLENEVLDDFGLNVRFTARLHITRAVDGRVSSSIIKILYIAHSSLPEDKELRLRLRRSDHGIYYVCSEGGRGYVCGPSN